MKRTVFLMLAALVVLAGSVSAEEPNLYSYRQLHNQSDVVLIVHPVSDKEVPVPPETDSRLLKMETILRVQVKLKGDIDSDTIRLMHYLPKKPGTELDSQLVKFNYGSRKRTFRVYVDKTRTVKQPRRQFLVFLKRHTDGTYEPASGHYHTATSITPLPTRYVDPPASNYDTDGTDSFPPATTGTNAN